MARIDRDQKLRGCLLDRLLADEEEAPRSHGLFLRELRESVRRDVENLLNTRRWCLPLPEWTRELETSLLNYGLPDVTGVSLTARSSRERLRGMIEETIRHYEPRFLRVSVQLLEKQSDQLNQTLRFRIEALMQAEPEPEPVSFETFVDPGTRTVAVKTER
jgi:type VI secretion system protein ImpF